ncbi:MAG: Xaa-Pro peptidase family protein [Actinomycetota bacterium]|jgi:Xaa-Pro aminopeptidase
MPRPIFLPLRVEGRLNAIAQIIGDMHSASAMVVSSSENIRYLSGFTGSAGVLICRKDDSVLVTDGRYTEQATAQVRDSGADVRIVEARAAAATLEAVSELLMDNSLCVCEASDLSVDAHARYVAALGKALLPVTGVVEELRRSKSEAEVERIAFAAEAADKALADVRDVLVRSMSEPITERDVRDELEYRMRRHGADGPSYETIVATGHNAAKPHHRPTDQLLREGDSVVIDVGGLVDGYHSDMTRTYLLGSVDPVLQTMFDVVSESQSRGVAAVRAGVLPSEIDRICREWITEAGFGPEFVHGTGHGVGLQIHESPWLRAQSIEPLREGEVVTVEPGVYRVGLGGVRIEDLLLVRAAGSTTLTHTPKDSLCLQSRQTI